MNIETQDNIDRLTREFIENVREQGVEIESIEVDWTDGKYDAKVRTSLHKKPRLPAMGGELAEPG